MRRMLLALLMLSGPLVLALQHWRAFNEYESMATLARHWGFRRRCRLSLAHWAAVLRAMGGEYSSIATLAPALAMQAGAPDPDEEEIHM